MRDCGGALSGSRLFYGIPVGKEQAGSIKCFVLLAAAAFALADVRACPQRACQTVRAVCRRVRVRRVFLATVDIFGAGFIADSRGCDVFERFCKLYVLCSKFCVIFFIRKWEGNDRFSIRPLQRKFSDCRLYTFFSCCNTYKNCFSSAYCKSDCVVL